LDHSWIQCVFNNVNVKRVRSKRSKGQLLQKIDDGGLGQQVAQLQIQTELAKTLPELKNVCGIKKYL